MMLGRRADSRVVLGENVAQSLQELVGQDESRRQRTSVWEYRPGFERPRSPRSCHPL